ncbi:adenosylcobinamide-phosphate synthase CbiB [Aquincola sp. MAHUQ-54]|uniref:Cobalamin biosynthesis protein CobD n=2 Tax=Sphaerotilaceae TaxID=2975441 RepID=A0AAW9QHD4_9BURK
MAMGVALLADRLFGEPPARWHPVVGIGRYLAWSGRRLPERPAGRAWAAGCLGWAAGACAVTAAAAAAEHLLRRGLPDGSPATALALAAVLGLLLKPMLAWRLLREEVQAVEAALAQGLDAGRAQVARLASRDTAALSAAQVRETAIETLAENLNDSVIAPLFWFAVAGLPGAVLFRYANTADAMWGYRGRWEWAGKCAARADDALAWLPARLCARALLPWRMGWRRLAAEARRTPSPNGGWPMGAMALALDVRLRKPGVYTLHAQGREPVATDVAAAVRRGARGLAGCAAALAVLAAAVRSFGGAA